MAKQIRLTLSDDALAIIDEHAKGPRQRGVLVSQVLVEWHEGKTAQPCLSLEEQLAQRIDDLGAALLARLTKGTA